METIVTRRAGLRTLQRFRCGQRLRQLVHKDMLRMTYPQFCVWRGGLPVSRSRVVNMNEQGKIDRDSVIDREPRREASNLSRTFGAPIDAGNDRKPAGGKVEENDAKLPRWATLDPLLAVYHAEEWGKPVRTEAGIYERLCLEAFQAGLSWLTVLRKREAFREAFAGFDPETVAEFTDADVERLMGNSAIIRNRVKIEATIRNARATLALRESGGLPSFVWSFQPEINIFPERHEDIPRHTPESAAMAAALRECGFRFVGPTTCFALMLAIGMVDGHLMGSRQRGRSGVWEDEWPEGAGAYPGIEPLEYHEAWGRLTTM